MIKRLLLVFATLALLGTPALASTSAQPTIYTCRLLSAAASDNATSCAVGETFVGTIIGYNASTSARWLKFYDKSTAPAPTDTPRESYYIPPSTAFAIDVNNYFIRGMGFRITTGSADNDTGALTSGDVLGLNVDYR